MYWGVNFGVTLTVTSYANRDTGGIYQNNYLKQITNGTLYKQWYFNIIVKNIFIWRWT